MSEPQLQYYGNLEVTLTIIERLRQLVGRQVTVYVSHVMRHQVGSLEVTGMLHAVGIDYLEVHVMPPGGAATQVVIPIHAVGAVSVGAPLAGPPMPPTMPPRPPVPPVGSL
ncbi:hypothetical protein [Desulfovirgula thermocuniculi]|uniref:hypothetical protein n=1 Tax=Desulfovirgula thermocuniculi TaxID=348842 RepID=UPI0003FE5547|nr:hypothetical protein [Desulfovirgula thermocuniculi]